MTNLSDAFAVVGRPNDLRPPQIAAWAKLRGFFVIAAIVVAYGVYLQSASRQHGGAQLATHSTAVPVYLSIIVTEWLFLRYCWAAVREYGGTLETLSGGRWKSWRDAAGDALASAALWAAMLGASAGVAHLLGTVDDVKSVAALLPKSAVEIALWIAASLSAGICEELVFRGFLQRQLHAYTGSIALAVILQAVVFGLFHSYQGWRNMVIVTALGLLLGLTAAWRRNVRANIAAHAANDIWAGWLGAVLFK